MNGNLLGNFPMESPFPAPKANLTSSIKKEMKENWLDRLRKKRGGKLVMSARVIKGGGQNIETIAAPGTITW